MRIFFLLVCAALSFLPAAAGAQARAYTEPELEGLLAPIALYPDAVLSNVLAAAVTPDQVAQAAEWSRMNRGMTPEDAVRAVQGEPWQPAVKALVAYPDLLEQMAQSPQWTFDLGNAYLGQPAETNAAVQNLRQRAYAQGSLQSDPYQSVQYAGPSIVVVPATSYVYVRYYDPWVVYGPSWRPAYRPVYWRPWVSRPVYVNRVVVRNGPPSPAVRFQRQQFAQRQPPLQQRQPAFVRQEFHRVPESRRQPIVQSHVPAAFPQHQRPALNHPQHSESRQHQASTGRSAPHQRGGRGS